jgi:hypothetical protein
MAALPRVCITYPPGRRADIVALRLVNGTTVAQGRLVLQLGTGEWTTLCSSFDDYNAAVACRQLGMDGGRATPAAATLGAGSGLRALNTSIYCTGAESSLAKCSIINGSSVTSCSHSDDVAVYCDLPRRQHRSQRAVAGSTQCRRRFSLTTCPVHARRPARRLLENRRPALGEWKQQHGRAT